MEIRQLQYFIEIVRHRSFTAAAAALYTTQPGLTKSIKQLEDELGIRLIDRNKKFFELTDEGRIFYEHAQDVLNRFNDLYHVARDTSAVVSGRVNIGTVTIASAFFRDLESSFSNHYPDAYLNLREMTSREIRDGILAHTCDVGFVVLPVDEKVYSSIEARVINSDDMVAVMHRTHPLAGKQAVAIGDLRGEPLLLFNDDYQPHQLIMEMCTQHGFTPKVANTAPRAYLLMRMAANRRGISILPEPYAQEYCVEELVYKPFEPRLQRKLAIIYDRDRYMSRAVRAVLDFASTYFGETSSKFVRQKVEVF